MRIGTWNMQGKSDSRQLQFMAREDCDVWLLTEVSDTFAMAPGTTIFSDAMSPGRAWAAVWARDGLDGMPSIHQAAALAKVGELRVCSCVLPWRAARSTWPDEGRDLASITATAIGPPAARSCGGHRTRRLGRRLELRAGRDQPCRHTCGADGAHRADVNAWSDSSDIGTGA